MTAQGACPGPGAARQAGTAIAVQPGGVVSAVIRDRGPELVSPAEAVFDPSRAYRYLLTRTWDEAWPRVTWVMLNPSTADAFADDATVRRCTAFARAWHAGGISVVNLFAYRATRPASLRRAGDPVGTLNDEFILRECQPAATVIAAWGTHGALGGRASAVTRMLAEARVRMYCLGTTRDGHPRHPLYVPASTAAQPYEAEWESVMTRWQVPGALPALTVPQEGNLPGYQSMLRRRAQSDTPAEGGSDAEEPG